MSIGVAADILLANYLQRFLWADEDWLEIDGASATYWQARLAQTTTVDVLPDGRTKWRIRTRIVEQVPDGKGAQQVCVALNRYAAGWSFAYDPAEQTIDAIAAICALPQWDTFFLRLSEKAKLSAWMSDALAERLAAAVGGVAAYSHPEAQSGCRESFDATYYYLQALRGRPEWVLDLTRYKFPSVDDTAATIAEMVGAPDAVWADNNQLRIMLDANTTLSAGFDRHPIVGDGWKSSLVLPPRKSSNALTARLADITRALFNDPETNLLGAWTLEADGLTFAQWNTMSEVRNQEQLGSYTGHSAAELWGYASTLSDVLGGLSQSGLPPESDSDSSSESIDRSNHIVAAIAEQARPAIAEHRTDGEEPADRRLLWLEHRQTLAVAVWFNPMGPTVSSTEICALPDGTEYLVHFRRHPFAPYHCVLGLLAEAGADSQLFSDATDLLVRGSLPNVLALWNNPEATASDVPDVLRDRILEVAAKGGRALAADVAWIKKTMGNPWEFAAVDQTEAEQVKMAAAAHPASDGGFAAWWETVSSFDNVVSNFRFLPDAWDGALNTQRTLGRLGHFDVDPLLVTYSNIGLPDPKNGQPDN
ncbi:hypothetical protein [Mycobacterium sp. M26]|uniref:hypothetical protein n=1 Tax=Mycobacterium sp. M26 TaxID=1762962 RepID=UPI00073E36CF|nr:hypothetical protein [Mycobacterium sp. M26]